VDRSDYLLAARIPCVLISGFDPSAMTHRNCEFFIFRMTKPSTLFR
jgi:hypothetical protein